MKLSFRLAAPFLFVLLAVGARAQGSDSEAAKSPDPPVVPASKDAAPAAQPETLDKRVFGVFPNYRTANGDLPYAPITTRQKFAIGFKDSFDWPTYLVSGAFAGLYQLENDNPSFGQGAKGYAKRFATSFGDQAIGNVMTEGVMPTLLHEDPRYFRRGTGSTLSRVGYALTRVFVTRTDSGGQRFNFSEWLGNSASVALSNAYYPDNRDVADNVKKLGISVATDAFSQVLKEFWPDVKRRWFHRRETAAAEPQMDTDAHR